MTKKKQRGDSRERLDKVPATVYLDEDQAAELDKLVAAGRRSKSDYLREAVDLVLERYSPDNMMNRFIERRRRGAKR